MSASESLFIWFVESASSALSCFWRKTYLSSTLTGLPLHLQKYVEQLLEHRYIVLCGERGLGKSYLATKLAEHVVQRWERNTKRHWVFFPRVFFFSRQAEECKFLTVVESLSLAISWKRCNFDKMYASFYLWIVNFPREEVSLRTYPSCILLQPPSSAREILRARSAPTD